MRRLAADRGAKKNAATEAAALQVLIPLAQKLMRAAISTSRGVNKNPLELEFVGIPSVLLEGDADP